MRDALREEIHKAFEDELQPLQPLVDLPRDIIRAARVQRDARSTSQAQWVFGTAALVAFVLVLGTVCVALRANRQTSTVATPSPSAGSSAGAGWTVAFPTVNPPARSNAAIAYDRARQEVVLFGSQTQNDTWVWDGKTWVEAHPARSPSPRTKTVMAYDAARKEVVLFGGSQPRVLLGDTWTWGGKTRTNRKPSSRPPARDGAAMACD